MSPEPDDQISIAIERLSTALVENERLKVHTDSMIAAMRAENERLTEENTGLKAKLCCTEGWGKSLTAALADNARLLVRINDQNVDYKKLEDDNTKCLKIIGELRTENERLLVEAQKQRGYIGEEFKRIAGLEAEVEGLRALYGRCIEALIWCSGSADFGSGGQAHEGWQKLAKPLLDDFCENTKLPQEIGWLASGLRAALATQGHQAMTDIAQRLRESADHHAEIGMSDLIVKAREAADELDRLRALSQNNATSWDAIVRERDALRTEVERLQIERTAHEAYVAHASSNNDQLRAEIERLKELFALKWDATQSAETEALRTDNERLKVENAELRNSLNTWIAIHGPSGQAP